MVCLGVFIECKRSHSLKDYIILTLVIIAILVGLRIVCYTIYRLLKKDHHYANENPRHGLQMHRR